MSFPPPAKKLKQSTLDRWKKKDSPVSNPEDTARESLCTRTTAEGETSHNSPIEPPLNHKVPTGHKNQTVSKETTNQKDLGSLSMYRQNSMGGQRTGDLDPTSAEETVWSLLSGDKEELSGSGSRSQEDQHSSQDVQPRSRTLHPDFKAQLSREQEQEEQDSQSAAGGHYHRGDSDPISRGMPIEQLDKSSPTTVVLPQLRTNHDHTVLTSLLTSASSGSVGGSRERKLANSDQGKGRSLPEDPHLWHPDFVKMPFSKRATVSSWTYTYSSTKTRWEVIYGSLTKPILQFRELKEAILSYNDTHRDLWTFDGLEDFLMCELGNTERIDFYDNVLPNMTKLVLDLPQLCSQPIPLLKKGTAHSITMSQKQAACLLANAFFCTFPESNSRENHSSIPGINFSRLYRAGIPQKTLEKLKCLLHYFKTVTENMPQGNITFSRQVTKRHDLSHWDKRKELFPRLHVSSGGTIEDDGYGMLQVDFANKYIGGGVLGEGCVQEEIRFVICPELLVSLLITEVLDDNEAVVITGSQRYSNYKGYATSFKWAGGHDDQTPQDSWGRRCTQVVAIDAINVKRYVDGQFETPSVRRELNKAYVGFYDPYNQSFKTAVATGNWGCGAFGGDSRLKALIQLMAAAAAGRDVCYFTYKDNKLTQDIYDIHKIITDRGLTVGDVWGLISDYDQSISSSAGGYTSGRSTSAKSRQGSYRGAGNDRSMSAVGARNRKNVFEFIREKVMSSAPPRHTPSSPGDRHGGPREISYPGNHQSGTDGSSYREDPNVNTRGISQRSSSNLKTGANPGNTPDDNEEDWVQVSRNTPL